MRTRALALLTGILVLGSMPGPALAAATLDQSNEGGNYSFCGPGTFAQTVTVGRAGKLTSVDLLLSDTTKAYTIVSIYSLDPFTGKPTGLALASYTVSVTQARWYNVSFNPAASFNSGGSFAIVFPLTATGCAVGSSGTYPGGQGLEVNSGSWANVKGDANLDFAFRTYVEAAANPTAQPVPTPTPAPVVTAAPTKTPIPAATAEPTTTVPSASAATADLTASPTASTASATPTALPEPQSGGSGGSPIVLIIIGIVALAAVLGGGIGLGFILARRPRPGS